MKILYEHDVKSTESRRWQASLAPSVWLCELRAWGRTKRVAHDALVVRIQQMTAALSEAAREFPRPEPETQAERESQLGAWYL